MVKNRAADTAADNLAAEDPNPPFTYLGSLKEIYIDNSGFIHHLTIFTVVHRFAFSCVSKQSNLGSSSALC